MNRALFLDLDGTIITTKSGRTFPKNHNDWKYIDGILDRIKLYHAAGYNICIVTNQAGISAGYITEEEFNFKMEAICTGIENALGVTEPTINFRYCKEDTSYNRKPNPGMIYEHALEHEIDLSNSLMVGDRPEDMQAAANAGVGKFIWSDDFCLYKQKGVDI